MCKSASRAELMQLYLAALTDYQFQVNLTWSRTQYCLSLNAGLLSVAAALFHLGRHSSDVPVIGVLIAGIVIVLFSMSAYIVGRQYYLPVIARMKKLEEALGIAAYGVRTTPEQGGAARRMKVSVLLQGLLVALGAIDISGLAFVIHDYVS